MQAATIDDFKNLYRPSTDSHKGQNGKLLIIGGSHLFHAASLWALEVASRIVDLVHYSSIPENNELVLRIKSEFRDGIVVRRQDIESYIEEDDCILIGPGMVRDSETERLTNSLLSKYPQKQWVIDAGALQMMDANFIPRNAILTPHRGEFEHIFDTFRSFSAKAVTGPEKTRRAALGDAEKLQKISAKYRCIFLLKDQVDLACNGLSGECRQIHGGNPGMTKGGTGDVLAGLIAALVCKNDPWLATLAGSFINKAAGDELYQAVGPYFNASDLSHKIPLTMKRLFAF